MTREEELRRWIFVTEEQISLQLNLLKADKNNQDRACRCVVVQNLIKNLEIELIGSSFEQESRRYLDRAQENVAHYVIRKRLEN